MAVRAQTDPTRLRLSSPLISAPTGAAAAAQRTHEAAAMHLPPARWLVLPAAGVLLAAVAALWRRRIQPASLTPVSAEWLRTHGVQAGRQWDP